MGELSDCWRNLQTLVEDDLLALETNVFRPFDETGQISDWSDVLADTEVLGGGLEERVLLGLGGLASTERRSSGLLSGLGGFRGLVIETRA